MTPIRVLVGAAEPMYRLGLMTACAAAGLHVDGELLLGGNLLWEDGVDRAVVVTELALVEPEAARAIARASERHRVLLIDSPDVDKPRMLRAGASGFVGRTVDPDGLRRAVEAAAAGDLVLPPPEATPAVARTVLVDPDAPRLTERESAILRLLAEGRSTSECALLLSVSVTTLKTHLRNVNVKLGTRSRTAAVGRATGLGLL